MPRPRSDLQAMLDDLPGITKAYFQPPESVKLQYDCIVYSLQPPSIQYADNKKYLNMKCYRVVLISKDPDCQIADLILETFDYISLVSTYHTDNLHHWAYTLFY